MCSSLTTANTRCILVALSFRARAQARRTSSRCSQSTSESLLDDRDERSSRVNW